MPQYLQSPHHNALVSIRISVHINSFGLLDSVAACIVKIIIHDNETRLVFGMADVQTGYSKYVFSLVAEMR